MGQPTSENKRLFVTVGTTKFDELITTICSDECRSILAQTGYRQWRIQYGAASKETIDKCRESLDIGITSFDYKDSIEADIEWADLVIGHAGNLVD